MTDRNKLVRGIWSLVRREKALTTVCVGGRYSKHSGFALYNYFITVAIFRIIIGT